MRDALQYGPSAPQRNPDAPGAAARLAVATDGLPAEGEDCLVLNVWTPAVNDGRRPVMFWCHGGGFATGIGILAGTDGTNLARRGDVVVVTINHRLNVLGFTNLVEAFGRDYAQSGDVGMLDIVQALQWVRTNIERFGGDPNTVMIFGQSGGGRKVSTLLTMPSAKGLFHRAVIESGATIKLVERDAAAKVAERLLKKLSLNNTQLRELQNLPVQKIMSAYFAVVRDMAGADQMTAGFSPTMDGKVVSQHPYLSHRVGRVRGRAGDDRQHAHRADAVQRRGGVLRSTRTACANASPICWANAAAAPSTSIARRIPARRRRTSIS